jgi:hypothetical protein
MNCVVCNKKLAKRAKITYCRLHRNQCPEVKAYQNKWRLENKDRYQKAKNKWVRENPTYYKNYREQSLSRKIAHHLRTRIRRAVKTGSALKNLGCTIDELRRHLESKFSEGMTWDNYGEWQIDHIYPLSKLNLEDPEQFKKACHYSNLQPLWRADNIRKLNKLDYNVPTSALQAKKSA